MPRPLRFLLTIGVLVGLPLGLVAWGGARTPRALVVLITPGVSSSTAHERLLENDYRPIVTNDPSVSRMYQTLARHNAAYFLDLEDDRVREVGAVFASEEARRVRRSLERALGDPVTEEDGLRVYEMGSFLVSAALEESMGAYVFTVHPAPDAS